MTDMLDALRDLYNVTGPRFVICELELGVTFYALAQSTANKISALRNTANAIQAYDSAMRHVKNLVLTKDERATFNGKKTCLEGMLASSHPREPHRSRFSAAK